MATKSNLNLVYSLASTAHGPIPQSLDRTPIPQATLEIPAGMVKCSMVNRPYTALKTGPGDQYPNQNSLLRKGTEVVLTYETPVWKKIYVPNLKLSGWVHSKALGLSFKNPTALKIHTNHLSVITTIQQSMRVYPSYDGKPTMVKVPRGLPMARLTAESHRQLVWLPATPRTSLGVELTTQPSVFWIDRRDAW
jgi:SH3-like domain-containing protein